MEFLMKKQILFVAALVIPATIAWAHDGVKNAAVMARMDAMSDIGAATKILGNMARGRTDFDQSAAQAAATTIATKAAMVPALFEAQEDDPLSEARDAIWSNFDDFTAKSNALQMAAEAAAQATSLSALRAAMGGIGGSCKDCHQSYRE